MSNSPWYRFALSILLLLAMIWLWSNRFNELSYHTWQSETLIDLGDATSFEKIRDQVPVNSYVSVSGILGNKAATLNGLRAGSFRYGRYQVRHLLGSKLYIEYDESRYHKMFNPFTEVSVKGRLTSLHPGSELEKVREFFKNYYRQPIADDAMLIVVDEKPRSEFIYGIFFIISLVLLVFSFYFSIRGLVKGAQ